jgi:hypothetical protein
MASNALHRDPPAVLKLSLSLLMTCVFANHTHNSFAAYNLAFGAYLSYRRSNFHDNLLPLLIVIVIYITRFRAVT